MRTLGQSDLQVQPIIFGAWAIGGWFWGGTDDDNAIDAIRASLDHGIMAIDTAPMYGYGHSEEVVGRAIRGRRDQAIVMTKCGLRWDDERGATFFDTDGPDGRSRTIKRNLRPDSIRRECEASLKRLGVDTIDLYQCHWPDPTTPVEESMQELGRLVEEGKVRAIGVSNFTPELMTRAREALGSIPLASNQPRYSLLTRGIEDEVLPWCREHEVGVVVYSPMERGLLSGAITEDRTFPETDGRSGDPLFRVENRRVILEALRTLDPIARAHDATFAQLAVAWCTHQPGITAALVGARTAAQASENARGARLSLSDEDLVQLRSCFEKVDIQRR
ncbi:MAG: aldo/keto reductase [Myxococcota bacterium]|nr:aldo/keto reductase [Myxococcota bacterium]